MTLALDQAFNGDHCGVRAVRVPTPPKVLIVTTARWLSSARLALTFSEAGFDVEAVCPPGHALSNVGFVAARHVYRPSAFRDRLGRAIDLSAPDLIVPCDDAAARHLRDLSAKTTEDTAAVIARSLGDPARYHALASRSGALAAAHAAGVRRLETSPVADQTALFDWLDAHGFPAVLKTDGSCGGAGVRVVRTPAEARRAFAGLAAPPRLARAVKRRLLDRDPDILAAWRARHAPGLHVQRFVAGRDATVAFACRDGAVLAQVAVEVVRTAYPQGPATTVRRIAHPEMRRAVGDLARALGLSGLHGADFVIDADGAAHLIEINPRATPTGHLLDERGASLAAALYPGAVRLRRRPVAPPSRETIALFPQEIIRSRSPEPTGPARHDVPVQSPELTALGYADFRRAQGLFARTARAISALAGSRRAAS